ncbi:hypothetical protein ADL03_15625 [Nocardia sp. NRRL S-836]|nr:hypothetical protein ADL03_15625 [Nocardia sp. NRRL S-836]
MIFSDHHPDAEVNHNWFTLPEAPSDDQDGRLEDEHLDPVREHLLALLLHDNLHQPLLLVRAEPDEDGGTFALVVAVDGVPGCDSTVWCLLWRDDDHELTVLEHGNLLDALADFRHHVQVRAADPNREPYQLPFV